MIRSSRIGKDSTRRSKAEEDGRAAYEYDGGNDVDAFWKISIDIIISFDDFWTERK